MTNPTETNDPILAELRRAADELREADEQSLRAVVLDAARAERLAAMRARWPRRSRLRVLVPIAGAVACALLVAGALAPLGDDGGTDPSPLALDRAGAASVLSDAAALVEAEPRFTRSTDGWFASTTIQLQPDGSPHPIQDVYRFSRSWISVDGRTLGVGHVDFDGMGPGYDAARGLGERVGITLNEPDGRLQAIEYRPGTSTPVARTSDSVNPDAVRQPLIQGYPAAFVLGVPDSVDELDAYLPTFVHLPGGLCHGLENAAIVGDGVDLCSEAASEGNAIGAAIGLLVNAPLDAPQRSALYRYLAQRAVSGTTDAKDLLGRRGVALRFDTSAGRSELILDPDTGVALQTRQYDGDSPGDATLSIDQGWVDAPMVRGNRAICGGEPDCDIAQRRIELERAARSRGDLPRSHFEGTSLLAF